jgi:hypothetical protein
MRDRSRNVNTMMFNLTRIGLLTGEKPASSLDSPACDRNPGGIPSTFVTNFTSSVIAGVTGKTG